MLNPPADLPTTTENSRLRRLIGERIAAAPLTFRDFMEMALYTPREGYYMSRRLKLGREGDFLTSPEVHPAFGACVARALLAAWRGLGEPATFAVVEPGAGSGVLAADVLGGLLGAGVPAVDYRIVEASPALEALQRERLEEFEGRVRWCEWGELPRGSIRGVIISNELFDSLPVHRVRVTGGVIEEQYVVEEGGALAGTWGKPSTLAIEEYFAALGLLPGEGCVAEVNLAAPAAYRTLAAALAEGAVFTFDYGYEAPELYAPWRTDGTLLCFYRHASDVDPFARVGRQDMTSHVDFTTLRRAGREQGLAEALFATQSAFLAGMGIGEYLDGGLRGGLEEYLARRRGISTLLDTGGLGRVRVLAQYRGAGAGAALREAFAGIAGVIAGDGDDARGR